ncbi:MAG: tail fiber domain-containing protein [Parafilimonas sp.]
MKKLSCYLIFTLSAFAVHIKTSAQSANTSLSNLTAPVQANEGLIPDKNNKHNLGSSVKAWRNLYLDSAVYFNNSRFLSYPGAVANTAVGFYALSLNPYAGYNTANGYAALKQNTSGNANSATGAYALFSNIGGHYNTANGYEALYSNTNGDENVATGYAALSSNQTGYNNTANGSDALTSNVSGAQNTAVGYQALLENNESFNTAIGSFALYQTTASQFNTSIGYAAGRSYNNGYNNVFVGANTDVSGAGYYNVIAIGQGTVCTGSSQVTMGNGATGSYRAYANWSNISDGRFKKNIKENVPGLAFINKLQPITYTLDATGIDNFLHADQPQDKQISGQAKALMSKALAEKEKVTYTGFIAQDVEKAAKSLSYDFSGVDAAKNSKDVYSLRYAEFVVPLVKAVQELSKQNDSLKQANNDLETKYENQQKEIDAIKLMIGAGNNSSTPGNVQAAIISSASLQQNIPNPFTNSTTISYSIPQKYSSAKIVVTDKNGAALKQFSLSSGNGSVTINASTLSSGAYQYALYADGKMIDSKQMLLTK